MIFEALSHPFFYSQMEIFKSNKSVLDYIASQSDTYSSEDFEKVGLEIDRESTKYLELF